MAKTKRIMTWNFPLPRTHTGVLLGNGVQGLMVWGEETLNVTVGRAGFWDHRSGNAFASRTTFRKLRTLVEAGDETAIREIFSMPDRQPGSPPHPQQYGGGRLELTFPENLRPVRADLDLATATLTVTVANAAGREEEVIIRQAMGQELAWLEWPESLRGGVQIKLRPTWEWIGEQLQAIGINPPETWSDQRAGGFLQKLPQDPALALAWADRGEMLVIATALGSEGARETATRNAAMADVPKAARKARAWWKKYWADVPVLCLPDPVLQRAYDYGIYKQAGLSTPGGVAASLQGPWLEEYQTPPWACDYHFNINIQMIYWPALLTNRTAHFGPLWDMVLSWLPALRENAKHFFEADEALMLPHAVDDRCRAVGQFWTGTIDHASTAWIAQMAWLHYRYSMDEKVLRDVAWPMLMGAFNGYWAMVEEEETRNAKRETRNDEACEAIGNRQSAIGNPPDSIGNPRLSLPVSVSPEYNGCSMSAWGRNASFQLAAFHCVAATLPRAAAILGKPVDPRWERVSGGLPHYSTVPATGGFNLMDLITLDPEWDEAKLRAAQVGARDASPPTGGRYREEARRGPRIALWEGKDLDASHRHPSHLACLYPFRTVDPHAPEHAEIVANSLHHWVRIGAGAWTGWAIAFATLIMARAGLAEGAIAWLHIWDDIFTNEGHGTLHDAAFPGFSVLALQASKERGEIMQMDAGMGVVTAILELLVQCRGVLGEQIVVLPVVPRKWRELSFDGVRAEGAFQIGATVTGGVLREVRVTSLVGGPVRLVHNLGPNWTLDGEARSGEELVLETQPGQKMVLRAV